MVITTILLIIVVYQDVLQIINIIVPLNNVKEYIKYVLIQLINIWILKLINVVIVKMGLFLIKIN
jgi:hypothetical protein